MIATLAGEPSLRGVLRDAVHRRSRRSLALQLLAFVAASLALLVAEPAWWFAAALLALPACHAGWGLLSMASQHWSEAAGPLRVLALVVAATATVLSVAGIAGLALALFTGTGRSPYDPCGPGATAPLCRAQANPPAGTLPRP